jgi:3-phosphoshikimate 1-carboxyvinyltransferase
VDSVKEGLERMGITVNDNTDRLIIKGGTPKGALIDSKNDHRIAMAFSLLGTVVGDTIIDQAECVAKTYPEYWNILQKLGGKVKIDEQ